MLFRPVVRFGKFPLQKHPKRRGPFTFQHDLPKTLCKRYGSMLFALSQKTRRDFACLFDLFAKFGYPKSDRPISFPGTSSGRVIAQGLFRYSWKHSLQFGQLIFCHDKFLTGFSRVVQPYNRQPSF